MPGFTRSGRSLIERPPGPVKCLAPAGEDPPVRTFIATAAHCILPSSQHEWGGDHVWAQGEGPAARDADHREIGRFIYASHAPSRDFALIEVAAGVEVDPQMCHWGGPTGLETRTVSEPMWLEHSGQGFVLGATFPGRTHLARTFDDPHEVRFEGAVNGGDSGSPIVTQDQGRAVGVADSISVHLDGPIRALRLAPQLAEASAFTGLVFELVTAPRL